MLLIQQPNPTTALQQLEAFKLWTYSHKNAIFLQGSLARGIMDQKYERVHL